MPNGWRLPLRFILASALIAGAVPATAAECGPLGLVTSVALSFDAYGRPLVPVTIGGKSKFLLLDTGGVVSTINKKTVAEFKLAPRRSDTALYTVSGDTIDRWVALPTFELGRTRGRNWRFMVEPESFSHDDDSIVGTLAPDLFRQFDLDLDFSANKLNLFSPDHCAGKVLYWRSNALAVVPMEVMSSGHIVVPVVLDGQKMRALVDTGAPSTVMNATVARRRFGLREDSADVEKSEGSDDLFYQFKVLELEGIVVKELRVKLLPDLMRKAMPFNPGSLIRPEEPQGLPDLIIGQSILSEMHVYIAYRERKLYLTEKAEQPAATPPAP